MKLETVTGTKSTVVKIGTAINTIKEFIKQGIIRPIKGVFYVESKAGSGLSYFSGSAPSLGATAVIPPAPIAYSITARVDETTSLKWHFDATPTGKAGTYDFGDTKTHTVANGESAHTYAAAGAYTVTFTPGDGNAAVTTDITVVAPTPPAEPPAV
jgi:PKD repeat protein